MSDSKIEAAKARQARAYSKIYGGRQGTVTREKMFESKETIMPPKDGIVMRTEYQVTYEESEDSLSEKGLGRTESWKDEM